MRFKYTYFIVSILFIGSLFYGCSSINVVDKESKGRKPLLIYAKGDVYKTDWKKVDSLEQNGLTKSALAEVKTILNKAEDEENHEQLIKALIIKAKLQSYIEEDVFVKTIKELTLEATKSSYPADPLIHSIIAEMYWQYYQRNRWKFQNRTTTVDFKNDDILTWSLNKIIEVTTQQYLLSIENIESLKRTPTETFSEIIIVDSASHYRPFLYDFLAHRAIDFFMNEQASVTKPAYEFVMDSSHYLSSYKNFAKIDLYTKDSSSLKFHALQTLQNLTLNHLNDTTPRALIDVDLKRLKFVKSNAVFQDEDSLYFKSLSLLYDKFSDFSSSTEIVFELAKTHKRSGAKYKAVEAEGYKWRLKKAINLCISAINKFPDSYGADQCRVLENQIKMKQLSVVAEKVNTPNTPLKANITFKNIDKVFFRLVKVDFDDYKKWNRNSKKDIRFKNIVESEKVKEWDLDLQNEGDFQSHSGEFKIDGLPLGFYILLTSSSIEFSIKNEAVAVTPFWVSNLSYLTRASNSGGVEFFVLNRESGVPLKGVTAKLYYENYSYTSRTYEWKYIGTKTTNENGNFSVKPSEEYRNIYADFFIDKDRLNTQDSYYQYKYSEPQKKISTRTVFFTDRAIYRPGQTVYFKGIVLETDHLKNNNIKINFKSTVELYDVNNQKISELNLVTNEYGTYSGSFVTPDNGLNGQMHISDKNGSKYFSVEEYKRPKFEVKFNPTKGSYKLGDEVNIVGLAKTYSGAALDAAQVNYRVVRNARFSYSCFHRYGYWPQSAEMEIENGTIKTDDNGEYNIDFIAKADKSVNKEFSPTYSYTVYADVVDVNGETHSAKTNVSVGYRALNIKVGIPEKLNKNKVDTFRLLTNNLNGQPEFSKGNVKVWSLKMPMNYYRSSLLKNGDKKYISKEVYTRDFPLDVYEDENNQYKWEKNGKVYDHDFDTEKRQSLELYMLPKWNSGVYVLEAITNDKYGEEVKEIKYFTVYSENEKQVPINKIGWFSPLKKKGEPGEKAEFLIGSAAKDVKVMYEIEHQNKIVHQEWININATQKKISIPIKEVYRGNFQVHFTFVKHGRNFIYSSTVNVPHTNKMLDIQFETFRNKLLPGQKEEWKIKIKGKKGEKVAAEMVATMYDASLDVFKPNSWNLDLLSYNKTSKDWRSNSSFYTSNSELMELNWNRYISNTKRKNYDRLNWFGYSIGRRYYRNNYNQIGNGMEMSEALPMMTNSRAPMKGELFSEGDASKAENNEEISILDDVEEFVLEGEESNDQSEGKNIDKVKARKNFAETAFFYPHLTTNKEGEIIINFTIPEALTRWKFMGLAHTKDLKTGMLFNETVTQKELMVYPNAPRFFREGDSMSFSSKITNLSEKNLKGEAKVFFYDALTMQLISEKILTESGTKPFEINKGKSTSVNWSIKIPEGYSAITYKVVAQSGKFSDGEEMAIPVLTNRMLVTESMPLPIRGNQTKDFKFEKLINNKSKTLKNYKLTLEFTSNPAWYAIQSLPYLMEYPYECAEQTFSRFYANSIASHVANSNPKIAAVFQSWKNSSPEAFLSNLEKNQELKSLILEETPWVLNSQNESERKKRVGLLFDLNRMNNELGKSLKKLQQLQVSNGGWAWFKGMSESRYMTQHIVMGMGHLDHLGVKNIRKDNKTWNMVVKAVRYLDDRIKDDYNWLKNHTVDLEKNNLNNSTIQYLYARSYFLTDIEISSGNKEAYSYYLKQAEKYWLSKSKYMQGMIALALYRNKPNKAGVHTEQKIITSLKENAINHEELGMYWKENNGGYYWYQAPIETQALLIEAFDEVVNDTESVEAMKVWLLKQKQTQDWKTTKATAEACYALLLRGTELLASDNFVEIRVGNETIDPKKMDGDKVEAGTGYFKTSWNKTAIKSNMGNVTVSKKDDGVAWGAMYWQYFEDLDKITSAETPLKLVKKLFVQRNSDTGPVIAPIIEGTKLKPGDKIKVRIELRVDRNMEYVHMKDMRASGLEPINVFSGYRYQDGLGYYESTKDASTNFFFDYLRKGTYVFEYELRVNMLGNFSNGVTSIQSMYAPEFSSHSEGVRLRVE
tara:strand:+ start:7220 stop:13384 length:6165 start_codon:yes stop_codon:yes gene_type:complete